MDAALLHSPFPSTTCLQWLSASPAGSVASAITDAVRRGDYAAVQHELARGANVNTTDKQNGWSLLHIAAYNGDCGIVKLLLSKGANVNATLVNSIFQNTMSPQLLGRQSVLFVFS